MNVLVLATLLAGLGSFLMLRRETFPEFQLEVILVSVPYPGGSPDEVEEGICQKVEDEIQAISGIKRLTSIAREGGGYVLAELRSNVSDPQKVLSEIRSGVDRVSPFFPQRSERFTVEQITFRQPAIRVAVVGPMDKSDEAEFRLRQVTEDVRDRLIELDAVSQASILGAKPFQIDVEVSEDSLRKYGLTLNEIADILRRESLETPSGQIKTEGQEILLRGKNKRETAEDIATLPVIRQSNGAVLTVGDIGNVVDDFDDVTAISEINGQPSLVVSVDRTSSEDLLLISDAVNEFVDSYTPPNGYQLLAWNDQSIDVSDRIRMLRTNGLQGLALVFIVLAIFLDFRLAFWVALGIPISVFGAGVVLLMTGQTLNMLSMFAFLMALGIVVDDAIVIGENIYAHREMGKPFAAAAIDGVMEVLPSVTSSIATTVVAFMPLFYVSGVMGKFIAVMPVAIIAMLLISLFEATFILPGHLSHQDRKPENLLERIMAVLKFPFSPLMPVLAWVSRGADRGMDFLSDRMYRPALAVVLRYPGIPIGVAVSMLLIALALLNSGIVPFNAFPKLDGKNLTAMVIFPDGTPAEVADAATARIEQAARDISERIYRDQLSDAGDEPTKDGGNVNKLDPLGPIKLTFRQVGTASQAGGVGATQTSTGSHVGQVFVELVDSSERTISSGEIVAMWREAAGEFTGAERVTFDTADMGPGGAPIEFKILAPASASAELEAAVEESKAELRTYAGVFDIRDDSAPGKIEFQTKIKDSAQNLNVTQEQLSETIRAAFYGAEVMRLQRGRHEVKLMVRYPENERKSIADFREIRVRTSDGDELPIGELAEITPARGYSEINRLDQKRAITVTASLDETKANASGISSELQAGFMAGLIEKYPNIRVSWEGQQQETQESFFSLLIGFSLALMVMYLLLVIEFRSYFQPLLVLTIIPFGIIGAVYGHALMGLPLTLFSMFGLVSLTGVVVNDSIVLLDFINHRVRDGVPINQALMEAGTRRLRPVFLTSITTVAGLYPMLRETSFQAQVLIPMATSLAFGIIMSTFLVLFLVPTLYWFYLSISRAFGFDPAEIPTGESMGIKPDESISPASPDFQTA
jgi:multidrug efflux pump subunit AcrB